MLNVSFIEMGSGNPGQTSDFFSSLFGWRFHPVENESADGGGWFETPSGRIGLHGNDPQWQMLPYFGVENIEEALSHIVELGGKTDDGIANEPGFGRFCHCTDPQGMRFGLHQALS